MAEKGVQFFCNTSAKLVTRVQISNGFWLAENTKETTKNQSDFSSFNNKIEENGHSFLHSSTLAGRKQVLMH